MLRKPKILAAAILMALAPLAGAQTTPPPAPPMPPTTTPVTTTASVPANRLAGLFAGFLGSRENALALVNALRTGTSTTIVATTTCAAPCTTPPVSTGTTIEVATKPMGWGNVRHALGLAQFSLAQAGITNPTPEQVAAALNGGSVTTDAGKVVEMNGILTQRASGMGWGQIAKAEGTTMGKMNHSLKPFHAVTTPTPAPAPVPAPGTPTNMTTAAGAASVTTAAGSSMAPKVHSQPGRGIVNGNGAAVMGGGVSSGNGHGNAGGNANGHAKVHGNAAGTSAGVTTGVSPGVTTAANSTTSTTITTAQGGSGHGNGNGRGNGNGHGNGKGK